VTAKRPGARRFGVPALRVPAGAARPMWLVGGLLSLIGAMLPWATFVLNNGPYPEKSTLEFFITPFGVTGFRM